MMLSKRTRRAGFLLLSILVSAAIAAPSASADDARYEGASAEGDVVFFSTTDKLVPGDTDNKLDIYERSYDAGVESYVTREVSFGPSGGNNAFDALYLATDEAGDRVFFSTNERLTQQDKDTATDIYVRDLVANETTLVSAGDPSCLPSGCGTADSPVSAAPDGVVADGTRVVFVSAEALSTADKDSSFDVYVRDLNAGTTTLASLGDASCPGPECGNGVAPAFFEGASTDGSTVVFSTTEALSPADTDALKDIYQRKLATGETKLVSTPGACPGELDCKPVYGGTSVSGSHVYFETREQIAAEDDDEAQDVYDWSAGVAALVSQGPLGGNGAANALYEGSSEDGAEVFFATDERLTGTDTDNGVDVYVRTGGSTTALVSVGDGACAAIGFCDKPAKLRWVSADGSIAVLSTQEPLVTADEDESFDIYTRGLPGGPTTLVSVPGPSCTDPECGNAPDDANFAGASADGSHILFITEEALVPPEGSGPFGFGDRDTETDVYDRSGGTTTLVSAGQPNEESIYRGNDSYPAQLLAVSRSGAVAFFVTEERMTESDVDVFNDVYQRSAGTTLLVSRGNDAALEAKLAPPVPTLERTDPPSPNASTTPRVIGSEANATASIKLYTTADCSGEAVATGSAAELAEPGFAVTVTAGATTSFRATAESEGFVSSCSAPLAYRQESPAPPGGSSGGGGGGTAPAPGPAPASPTPKAHNGISYLTPVTRITFGPASKTRARRPTFRFTDSTGQPGTRFLCKVDRGRWSPCSSPTRLRRLRLGKHIFEVLGINAVGVKESHPATRSFKVVARAHR